jgi:hypothetical protein
MDASPQAEEIRPRDLRARRLVGVQSLIDHGGRYGRFGRLQIGRSSIAKDRARASSSWSVSMLAPSSSAFSRATSERAWASAS